MAWETFVGGMFLRFASLLALVKTVFVGAAIGVGTVAATFPKILAVGIGAVANRGDLFAVTASSVNMLRVAEPELLTAAVATMVVRVDLSASKVCTFEFVGELAITCALAFGTLGCDTIVDGANEITETPVVVLSVAGVVGTLSPFVLARPPTIC